MRRDPGHIVRRQVTPPASGHRWQERVMLPAPPPNVDFSTAAVGKSTNPPRAKVFPPFTLVLCRRGVDLGWLVWFGRHREDIPFGLSLESKLSDGYERGKNSEVPWIST